MRAEWHAKWSDRGAGKRPRLWGHRSDRGLEGLELKVMLDFVMSLQGTWLPVSGSDTTPRVSAVELPSENPERLEA